MMIDCDLIGRTFRAFLNKTYCILLSRSAPYSRSDVIASAKQRSAKFNSVKNNNNISTTNSNNITTPTTHQFFLKRSEIQAADPVKKWSEVTELIDLNFNTYEQVQTALKTAFSHISQIQHQHKNIRFIQCREPSCKSTEFDSKGGSGNPDASTGIRRHYIQCKKKHSAENLLSVLKDTAERINSTATNDINQWCHEFTKAAQKQHQQQINVKTKNLKKRVRTATPTPTDDSFSADEFESQLIAQDNNVNDNSAMLQSSSNNNNNNFDFNRVIGILESQLAEQKKEKDDLIQQNTALQQQLQELQTSFQQFREEIREQLQGYKNKQPLQEHAADSGDGKNDFSAVRTPSYSDIAKKRAIFKFVAPNPTSTRQKAMSDCNKVVNGEFNTLGDILNAVQPKERKPSAERCEPIYAEIKLTQLALQGEYRIIKEISQKATGRHPYNIRSVYGGIYELAYDADDVEECRRKLREGGIKILQNIDIFSVPPTNPDKPRDQTRKQVASSMGFALGRAYHPAVAAMYQRILSAADEAELYKDVEKYSRNIKDKYLRIARLGPATNRRRQQTEINNNGNGKKNNIEKIKTNVKTNNAEEEEQADDSMLQDE